MEIKDALNWIVDFFKNIGDTFNIFSAFDWLFTILKNIVRYGNYIFSFFSSLLDTGIDHLNAGNVVIFVLILILILKIIHNIK